jgi:hypothetical protein
MQVSPAAARLTMAPRIGVWVAWSLTVPVIATAALRDKTRLKRQIIIVDNFARIIAPLGERMR